MNLDRLRLFVRIAQTGSFTSAARELGLSQPAASQSVKTLEQELGVRLFERDVEGVTPTSPGRLLQEYAQRILSQWDEAVRAVRTQAGTACGPLAVAASTVASEHILPTLVRQFLAVHPKVEVGLVVKPSAQVMDEVAGGRADVGVAGCAPTQGLQGFQVAEDELVLIAPADHRWAGRTEPVRCVEFAREPFVVRELESGTRQAMEHSFREWGIDPAQIRITAAFGSTEAVVSAVEAGMGISFVSRLSAERAVRSGRVAMIPDECPHRRRRFYCVYRETHAHELPVQAFLSFLREYAGNMGA